MLKDDIMSGNKILENVIKSHQIDIDENEAGDGQFNFNQEEKEAFKKIDRDKESEDVIKFQETGDANILEELYNNRIPTLNIWSYKYKYVGPSRDDVFADMRMVFIRAVHKYNADNITQDARDIRRKNKKKKPTPFNTYLYYALQHYVINQWSRKRVKKRTSIDDIPADQVTLSLNFSYDEDGEGCSLFDVVPNEQCSEKHLMNDVYLSEVLDILAPEHNDLRNFLKLLSVDGKTAALLSALKISRGRIRLNQEQKKKFGGKRKYKRLVSELVSSRKKINGGFKLLEYKVDGGYLYYAIEMNYTKEHEEILIAIKNIKKNKDYLLKKIRDRKRI